MQNLINKKFIFVLLISILSLSTVYSQNRPYEWDEVVYIMNAKYFSGNDIYYEDVRPPLFPLFLSLFVESYFLVFIPSFIALLVVITTYFTAKKMYNDNVAVLSSIILMTPLFLLYSNNLYTEIFSSLFVLISSLFVFIFDKYKKNYYIYISFLSASLAFLIRYVSGIIFIIPLSYLIIKYRSGKAKLSVLAISIATYLVPLSIYIAFNFSRSGDAFSTLYYAFYWPFVAMPEHAMYYFFNLFELLGFSIVFIIFCAFYYAKTLKNNKESVFADFRIKILLITIVVFILFLSAFPHKELRYFIVLIPTISILVSSFAYLEKRFLRLFIVLSIVVLALNISLAQTSQKVVCTKNSFMEMGEYLKGDVKSTVMSMFWPETSYYSDMRAVAFPEDPKKFEFIINKFNVSHVITSDSYGWPDYAKNQSFFNGKNVAFLKGFEDYCFRVYMYKVVR